MNKRITNRMEEFAAELENVYGIHNVLIVVSDDKTKTLAYTHSFNEYFVNDRSRFIWKLRKKLDKFIEKKKNRRNK